jgi:hypothetical protein
VDESPCCHKRRDNHWILSLMKMVSKPQGLTPLWIAFYEVTLLRWLSCNSIVVRDSAVANGASERLIGHSRCIISVSRSRDGTLIVSQ